MFNFVYLTYLIDMIDGYIFDKIDFFICMYKMEKLRKIFTKYLAFYIYNKYPHLYPLSRQGEQLGRYSRLDFQQYRSNNLT